MLYDYTNFILVIRLIQDILLNQLQELKWIIQITYGLLITVLLQFAEQDCSALGRTKE